VRLRKKPWIAEALTAYSGKELIENDLELQKGHWRELLGTETLSLEIGSGKGAFITEMAGLHPDQGFLGLEVQREICYHSVKKIREQQLPNVKIICGDGAHLAEWFLPGEVDCLYLNFSDPWPKARHAKRRLTYHTFLATYKEILRPQGHLRFKTDNDALFAFSLEEFKAFGVKILAVTNDLHHSGYENEVQTEYEKKFSALGKKINFCEIEF
jgi:tRNA (guanine-N7-)-methyltransferase